MGFGGFFCCFWELTSFNFTGVLEEEEEEEEVNEETEESDVSATDGEEKEFSEACGESVRS